MQHTVNLAPKLELISIEYLNYMGIISSSYRYEIRQFGL